MSWIGTVTMPVVHALVALFKPKPKEVFIPDFLSNPWANLMFDVAELEIKNMSQNAKIDLCTFGIAVECMKNGAVAYRQNWKPNFLIFRQVPSTVPHDIIPRMTSLPLAVKSILVARNKDVTYRHQFACLSDMNVIEAYIPTIADMEATDWVVPDYFHAMESEPIVAGETVGTAKPLE